MFLERWLSWHASFRQSCRSVGGDQSTLLTPAAETRLTAGQRNRTVGAKRWVEPISPNRSLPSRVQFRHFPGLKLGTSHSRVTISFRRCLSAAQRKRTPTNGSLRETENSVDQSSIEPSLNWRRSIHIAEAGRRKP